jgi:hypothetical protein
LQKKTSIYYKLVAANIFSCLVNKHKSALHQELYDLAADTLLVKRRLRMLRHLSEYESSIYAKLNQFDSENLQDYVQAIYLIAIELQNVTDRCA